MNRREFIRTAIATTTLLAVAATGVFEIGAKVEANQANAQAKAKEIQLPPVNSETVQASTTQLSQAASNTTASSQVASASSQSTSAPTEVSTSSSQTSSASQATSESSQSSSSTSQDSSTSSESSSTASLASSGPVPDGYFFVAQLSSLNGETWAYFTHPSFGQSIILTLFGQWYAFTATCTHKPCTTEVRGVQIYCPCHGATFNATNGSVEQGPATVKIAEYGVIVQDGSIYVSASVIN